MSEPTTEAGKEVLRQNGISEFVLPEDIAAVEDEAVNAVLDRLAAEHQREHRGLIDPGCWTCAAIEEARHDRG